MTAETISWYLMAFKFRYQSEIELHEGITLALTAMRAEFVREYRLTEKDRLDFYLPNERIAIEVKIKGSAAEVLRQLTRYAEHDEIQSIVLVTTRTQQAYRIPTMLNEKAITVCLLRSL
jgi:hypothetical protein